MAQWKRASFRVDAGTSGFIYISDSDRTVPAELGEESQASSCVEEWNPTCLSSSSGVTSHLLSCMWNLRVFPDDARGCQCPFVLCLHPQGCLRRGVRAWVLVKRGPENRGLLACGTTRELRLEFPRETGLILKCPVKVGNPLQTKQGK